MLQRMCIVCLVMLSHPVDAQMRNLVLTPVMRIGNIDGDRNYSLNFVTDALRLSDGRVVISLLNELRYYDATGKYVRTSGGSGEGPSEFRRIDHMRLLPNDSVLVFSSQKRAKVVFAPNGSFARSEPAERFGVGPLQLTRNPRIAGGDGSLATRWLLPNGRVAGYMAAGSPYTFQFLLSGPGGPILLTAMPTPLVTGAHPAPLFSVMPVLTVAADRIIVGNGDRASLLTYRLDGTPSGAIKLETTSRAVTRKEVDRYIDWVVKLSRSSEENAVRRDVSARPVVKSTPYFASIHGAENGDVWVAHFNADPLAPGTWSIIDRGGRETARATLPPRFRPTQIASGFLVGVERDDLNVEYVAVYRIGR